MSWEVLLGIFVGTGGAGSLLSAFLTYKSKKREHELDLLARAQEEIERLDKKVKEKDLEIDKKEDENSELNGIIQDLRYQMNELKITLQKKENYIDHLINLINGFKSQLKRREIE